MAVDSPVVVVDSPDVVVHSLVVEDNPAAVDSPVAVGKGTALLADSLQTVDMVVVYPP